MVKNNIQHHHHSWDDDDSLSVPFRQLAHGQNKTALDAAASVCVCGKINLLVISHGIDCFKKLKIKSISVEMLKT